MKYFVLVMLLATTTAQAETDSWVDDTECTAQLDGYQLVYSYSSQHPHNIPFDDLVWQCKPRDVEAINAYYAEQDALFYKKMKGLK